MTDTNNNTLETVVQKIITTWEENLQLDFLKIYPAFKIRYGILSTWISVYRSFFHQNNLDNSLDHKEKIEKTKELLLNGNSTSELKKRNTFNFLINGLENNFISNEPRDIWRIIKVLEEANEEAKYINTIKLYLTKCQITDGVTLNRKAISERKVKEMLPKQKFITASAKSFVDIIIKEIDCINPKDIAIELTRDYSQIINKINIHEFIKLAVNDNCSKEEYPNLAKLIERFTKLSYYIPTEIIIKRSTMESRIDFVRKMIKVAYECKELGNFHCVFAITAGLNHCSIQRIKELWNEKHDYIKKYKELESFTSPLNNFTNYRTYQKTMANQNIIPYLGTLTSDIKHSLEKEIFDKVKGMINWDVYNNIITIIKSFESHKNLYNIIENSALNNYFINVSVCFDDDILYSKSQEIIPSKRGSIIVRNESALDLIGSSSSLNSITTPDTEKVIENVKLNGNENGNENKKKTSRKGSKIKKSDKKHDMRKSCPGNLNHSGEFTENNKETNNDEVRENTLKRSKHQSINIPTQKDDEIKQLRNRSISMDQQSFIEKCNESKDITNCPIDEWSVDNVIKWLQLINLSEYENTFRREEITGLVLVELHENHLKEMHVDKLGHRVTMMKFINQMKTGGL